MVSEHENHIKGVYLFYDNIESKNAYFSLRMGIIRENLRQY
jgi:hypothetical protein